VVIRKTDGQHTVDRCLETEAQKLELDALLVCWKIYLMSDMSDISCSKTEWQMYCSAIFMASISLKLFIVFFKEKLASLYMSYIHTRV
jgi:hypothetical protein